MEDELRQIEIAKTDPRQFAPLYKKYHEAIFRYIYKRVDEEESAYDITSCVFVKAISNLPKYEFRGVPFSSWLFRIAKSELYQSFRDNKAKRTVSIDSVSIAQIIDDLNEDYSEEQRLKLMQILPQLKEQQLQLIEMRFFEKRSFREIGEIIGMTENNAKVKTFRALVKLKELFNRTKA
ncbi:MAG: sigma-70 family RNA polymerase sigma factor [Flavobacteriales bacterium]|nr:sigma-70 family RNA polymerase sigma factor [Flavobacteriales bacterium]NCA20585.1 sigma-70 family RNA polymerase sigma factor [Crocinitomicaceae bacterium]